MNAAWATEPAATEPVGAPEVRHALVLDADTPWIHSLAGGLPSGWKVDRLGAKTVGWKALAWWVKDAERVRVPGWTKAFGWSTSNFAKRLNRYLDGFTLPDVVMHTIPWTAGLLDRFPDLPHVYRPHDHFGMYSWDQQEVARLETAMMTGCRLALPISAGQATYLQKLGPAPVHLLPNGVSSGFVRRLRGSKPPRPRDLPHADRPVVGCIGQINASYDVELMAGLADAVPAASFVYIGPVFDDDPRAKRDLDAAFRRPNVAWLGPRPHDQLPDYLHHFTACLNPLKKSRDNDCRSPLRLYDYLAAGKPVLSTPLTAAIEHAPFVTIGYGVADLAARLSVLLAPDHGVDLEALHDYVDDQTWEARGAALARLVDDYCR